MTEHNLRTLPLGATLGAIAVGGLSSLLAACTLLLPIPQETPAPICGRVPAAHCEAVIELVRDLDPGAFAGTPVPVVEYACPPGGRCMPGFEALAILVDPAWTDIAELPVYRITGVYGPERAQRDLRPVLPPHVIDLLPVPTP